MKYIIHAAVVIAITVGAICATHAGNPRLVFEAALAAFPEATAIKQPGQTEGYPTLGAFEVDGITISIFQLESGKVEASVLDIPARDYDVCVRLAKAVLGIDAALEVPTNGAIKTIGRIGDVFTMNETCSVRVF